MHASMKRLQEVAKTDKKSDIARDLNVGASTVTNWTNRGVSKEGALAAAEKYNANANYILNGTLDKPSNISYEQGSTRTRRDTPVSDKGGGDKKVSSFASSYLLDGSSASIIDLIGSLKDLESEGKLSPDLIRLLSVTIDTFKKISEDSK